MLGPHCANILGQGSGGPFRASQRLVSPTKGIIGALLAPSVQLFFAYIPLIFALFFCEHIFEYL